MSYSASQVKAATAIVAQTEKKKKEVNPIHLFNSIAKCFFAQIAQIFPGDATLEQLRKELERLSKIPKDAHVPAVRFCTSMSNKTGIIHQGETEFLVGDFIMMSDSRLFSDECSAVIPDLDALSFKQKWARLNPVERTIVWDYLRRMSEASLKVFLSKQITKKSVMEMVDAVKSAGSKIDPEAPLQDQVIAALSDERVDKITSDISTKIIGARK